MRRFLWLILLTLSGSVYPLQAINIISKIHPSETKQRLLAAYVHTHYGLESITLAEPQILVIHCTETANLKDTFAMFAPDELGDSRPDLGHHGDVNVGIHFVVDKDGTIYQLAPLDQITRHIIGFNYTAIGIENVARDEALLTPAQIEANVQLVVWLKEQRPTLRYLIGHHEYQQKSLPHFQLFLEKDRGYIPTGKKDPGEPFMTALRQKLKQQYNLEFLE